MILGADSERGQPLPEKRHNMQKFSVLMSAFRQSQLRPVRNQKNPILSMCFGKIRCRSFSSRDEY